MRPAVTNRTAGHVSSGTRRMGYRVFNDCVMCATGGQTIPFRRIELSHLNVFAS